MENEYYKFASFGQRALARIIDVIIVGVIMNILFVIFVSLLQIEITSSEQAKASEILSGFSTLFYFFLYQPILETRGGTFGKKIIGLRTINLDTSKEPTYTNSYKRSALYFVFIIGLGIPAILSCLAVLWNKNKQAWHDSMTNIAVVRN